MINHYLYTALKFHINKPLFAVVSITGLAIGFACCFLISLYVVDELSFDKNQPTVDQLYRVSAYFHDLDGGNFRGNAASTPLVGPLLVEDFSDVVLQARLQTSSGLLRNGDLAYYENQIRFIDSTFFDLFSFDWVYGDSEQAMALPSSIVLTESLAKKYFADEYPIGKVLVFENNIQLTVTGLIKDLAANTHLRASAFVTIDSLLSIRNSDILENWNNYSFHTYLRLKPDTDINNLQQQFPSFIDRHHSEGASKTVGLSLIKVSDIHLESILPFELSPTGSLARIYVFSAVSLCILFIASINFMNLALATASQRSKEVGLRKTLGAQSAQITWQLLIESILVTILAAMLAFALVELLLPTFNVFTGKQLKIDLFSSAEMLALHVLVVICVAFFSSIYPALFQAAYKPSSILNGVAQSGKSGRYFRNSIIILQFAISITLIAATTVIYQQLDYADYIEQGYSDENILVLDGSDSEGIYDSWQPLRQQLLTINGIENVSASNIVPQEENGNTIAVWAEGDADGRSLPFMLIDFAFFKTYEIQLLAGRQFSREFPSDVFKLPDGNQSDTPGNVILNRAAVQSYGWTPEEAIGKNFKVYHEGKFTLGKIVGVVDDGHFESLRTAIKPMVFLLPESGMWKGIPSYKNVSIALSGSNLQSIQNEINIVWAELVPDFPLQSHFLRDDKQLQYRSEKRQGQLLAYFTLLSIFIAAIGLFALACWNAALRTREIGVRKVMGSSVWKIVVLLTNEFSKLVLFSNLIAWPVAYIAMNNWLENFAYRIDLTPLVFVGSGLIALCIAWVTVGGTAAKAASQKPVLALRYE